MNEKSKSLLVALLVGTVTTLGVIGSTTGTIAWYAYSRSVTMSYIGTSVKKSLILSMGLVDDNHYIDDSHLIDFNLTRENVTETVDEQEITHSILWTNSTTGIALDALREYLFNSPYAFNQLAPVSSLSRTIDSSDNLTLYRSPDYGDEIVSIHANPAEYVQLSFVFKVTGSDGNKVANQDIWLTDVEASAEARDVEKAIRVFVQNDTQKFLFNPSDASTGTGYTVIGGVLDLDGDGTYDYDKSTMKEHVYHDLSDTNTLTWQGYPDSPYTVADPSDWTEDNVNQTPYTTEASTFYAKHQIGSFPAEFDRDKFGKAYYQTFNTVKPLVDSNGVYYSDIVDGVRRGIPVATTNSSQSLAYTTFTIYLEGWAYPIIDQNEGIKFNLGLTFEVNRP